MAPQLCSGERMAIASWKADVLWYLFSCLGSFSLITLDTLDARRQVTPPRQRPKRGSHRSRPFNAESTATRRMLHKQRRFLVSSVLESSRTRASTRPAFLWLGAAAAGRVIVDRGEPRVPWTSLAGRRRPFINANKRLRRPDEEHENRVRPW